MTRQRRATSQALRQRMLVDRRRRRRRLGRAARRCSPASCNRFVLGPVRRVSLAAERLAARQPRHPRGRHRRRARSASSAPRSTPWPGRSPRATRTCACSPTACADPGPHHDDDLGQGPRRPLPARQRRSGAEAMGQVGVDVIGRTDDELFPPDVAAGDPRHRPRDPAHRGGGRVRARRRHQRARVPARQVPAHRRGRLRLRHRHDGHRRQRAPPRAGRGRGGLALEVRVPGQHEPRDPHAAQRRDRHDRAAARDRARRRSSASTRRPPPTPARRCSTSSTTSSTSRRSRPASSSSTITTSTCARRSRTPARCSRRRRTARASS